MWMNQLRKVTHFNNTMVLITIHVIEYYFGLKYSMFSTDTVDEETGTRKSRRVNSVKVISTLQK